MPSLGLAFSDTFGLLNVKDRTKLFPAERRGNSPQFCQAVFGHNHAPMKTERNGVEIGAFEAWFQAAPQKGMGGRAKCSVGCRTLVVDDV
jgi:hypothetical protein